MNTNPNPNPEKIKLRVKHRIYGLYNALNNPNGTTPSSTNAVDRKLTFFKYESICLRNIATISKTLPIGWFGVNFITYNSSSLQLPYDFTRINATTKYQNKPEIGPFQQESNIDFLNNIFVHFLKLDTSQIMFSHEKILYGNYTDKEGITPFVYIFENRSNGSKVLYVPGQQNVIEAYYTFEQEQIEIESAGGAKLKRRKNKSIL